MITELLIILLALLLSAYFSGMEIAFVSANKMHIELERKANSFQSRCLTYLADRPRAFITTMLIGNNIALVVYGYFMGVVLSPLIIKWFGGIPETWDLLVQTLISTLIILITAEFLPKSIFNIFSNQLFKFFAVPTYFVFHVFGLFSGFILMLSNLVLKLLGGKSDEHEEFYLKEELKYYISEELENLDSDEVNSEIQIFHNALEFSDIKVRECLVPRKEIIAMELNDSIEDLKKKFTETGLSKIVIYKEDIDHIIGYVHSFDLYKNPEFIKHMLLPVEFVHETSSAKEVMNTLIKKRRSLAVVLDEYGGTEGILTIEDVVEELFGDIEDEHDNKQHIEEKISDTEFLFSARLEVDYLNETYNLNLPEDESYETLGGLLVTYHEDLPKKDEEIRIENFLLIPKKVSETNVEEILVSLL